MKRSVWGKLRGLLFVCAVLACAVFLRCFTQEAAAQSLTGSAAQTEEETGLMPVLGNKEYTYTLTQEQQQAIRITYSILERKNDGGFVMVLDRIETAPDREGVIHLDRDPKLVVLKTGEEEMLWPVAQMEKEGRNINYQTFNTCLLRSALTGIRRPVYDSAEVNMVLQERAGSGRLTLASIESINGAQEGQDPIDIADFGAACYTCQEMMPRYDQEGGLLPFAQWQGDPAQEKRMQVLEGDLSFVFRPASELVEKLYYIITLEYEDGQTFVTQPVVISPRREYELLTRETEKGLLTYCVYWNRAVLLSYSGNDESLILPGREFDVPVTEIAAHAFDRDIYGKDAVPALKSVTLQQGIQKIGSCAFLNCSALESVSLPNSISTVGSMAFKGCSSLQEISFPKRARSIGAYTFAGCESLTEITLPAGLRYIGDGIFCDCNSLTVMSFSGSSSSYQIKDGALYNRKRLIAFPGGLTGSFEVQKGTKQIAKDCFSHTGLSEVLLPEGLETIEDFAFYGAVQLQMPSLPDSLVEIGSYAFATGSGEIRTEGPAVIRLGKKLTTIGKNAFAGYRNRRFSVSEENLSFLSKDGALLNPEGDVLIAFCTDIRGDLLIPEGVRQFSLSEAEQVKQANWYYDQSPCHIYVPDSVTSISCRGYEPETFVIHCSKGSYAEQFARAEGFAVSYAQKPYVRKLCLTTEKGELTYLIAADHAVLTGYEGSDEELELPEEVGGVPLRVIGDGNDSLTGTLSAHMLRKLTIPDTVEVISAHAFADFGELKLSLPPGLRVIGNEAFLNCKIAFSGLPEGLEELGSRALGEGCAFSSGVLIPETLTKIGAGAFQGVAVSEFRMKGENPQYTVKDGMLYSGDGLSLLVAKQPGESAKLTVPEGTARIGDYAFYGSAVKEAELPDSVKEIGSYAFAYCRQLEAVSFGSGLEVIGDHAFVLSGLKEIILPDHCQRIGEAAFFGAPLLERMTGGAKTIGAYAFAYCDALRDLKLSEGMEEIGDHAFYHTAVTNVLLPDSLRSLGDYAFASDDEHLRSVVMQQFTIGKHLERIGEKALCGLPVSEYLVDPGNTCFATVSGMLTDASGKCLIACPTGLSGTVTVPEEICEISDHAFCGCENVTDVFLSNTIWLISRNAFDDHLGEAESWKQERVRIHCESGSAAYSFVIGRAWPYTLTDREDQEEM